MLERLEKIYHLKFKTANLKFFNSEKKTALELEYAQFLKECPIWEMSWRLKSTKNSTQNSLCSPNLILGIKIELDFMLLVTQCLNV